MEYIHFVLLGLVQGLSEFLPVSSSAHLILLPWLVRAADQGLAIDVAAHVGTLSAVIWYFRGELRQMLGGWHSAGYSLTDPQSRYIWYLLVATVPVALAGLLGAGFIEANFRDPLILAVATVVFGLLLWWADFSGERVRDINSLGWKDVLLIGLFQVLALIPGTSRSGITITAGLLLGLDRREASRFSFLLSIPVIGLAGAYQGFRLLTSAVAVDWLAVLIVALVSAMVAALTIHFFLKFLDRTGMLPYVIYRLLLGGLLFYLFI